jgi:hypothetical protein
VDGIEDLQSAPLSSLGAITDPVKADQFVVKDGVDGTIKTLGIEDLNGNVYYPNPAAANQGITGNLDTIKYYADQIGTDKATIVLRHNSGAATTEYTIGSDLDLSSSSGIQFEIERGAILSIDSGITLTIYSPANIIAAPNQQIFDCDSDGVLFSSLQKCRVYSNWWGMTQYTSTGSDWDQNRAENTAAIHAAIDAVQGYLGNEVIVANGTYTVEPISVDKAGIVLRAEGRFTAILRMYIGAGETTSIITTTKTTCSVKNFYLLSDKLADHVGIEINHAKTVVSDNLIENTGTGIEINSYAALVERNIISKFNNYGIHVNTNAGCETRHNYISNLQADITAGDLPIGIYVSDGSHYQSYTDVIGATYIGYKIEDTNASLFGPHIEITPVGTYELMIGPSTQNTSIFGGRMQGIFHFDADGSVSYGPQLSMYGVTFVGYAGTPMPVFTEENAGDLLTVTVEMYGGNAIRTEGTDTEIGQFIMPSQQVIASSGYTSVSTGGAAGQVTLVETSLIENSHKIFAGVEIEFQGKVTNTNDSKRITIEFGDPTGPSSINVLSTAGEGDFSGKVRLIYNSTSATLAKLVYDTIISTTHTIDVATLSSGFDMDSGSNTVERNLKIIGDCDNAGDSISLYYWKIKYLPKANVKPVS